MEVAPNFLILEDGFYMLFFNDFQSDEEHEFTDEGPSESEVSDIEV